jgi:DNA modification methylase
MGVGSEVYAAVRLGRRGIGIELKSSYYRQAVKNLASITEEHRQSALQVEADGQMVAL